MNTKASVGFVAEMKVVMGRAAWLERVRIFDFLTVPHGRCGDAVEANTSESAGRWVS
jgi:hypothetical protein